MKSARSGFLPLLMLLLAGCSNDATTSAQFAASQTPAAPGLVQLAQRTVSGSQVQVDVVIRGPEPGLDLSAFRFAIRISDPTSVRFLPQSSYQQSALVAAAGQTIAIDVDNSDPTLVKVEVEKVGGGPGNGVASPSAVVIGLTFEVLGTGGSTLSFTGLGGSPAQALDSNGGLIDGVLFDLGSASLGGVRTGGGGY